MTVVSILVVSSLVYVEGEFFFSSKRRHTRCALVTGVQTCALPILLRNTRVLSKSSLVFQGVGNGEYPLGISLEYAGYLWAKNGAPVKVIYPSDGTMALMEGVAVIKGGPNPDSAKAFVDFVNRKEVRELILTQIGRAHV